MSKHRAGCQDHHHGPTYDQVLARLKEAGLKSTRPRQALLKAIVDFDRPFSAEDLFNASKKLLKKTNCDLVTVYRSLASFAEIDLVSRVDLGDGVVRYEIASFDGSHHHHIVCTQCRRVESVSVCTIKGEDKILSQMGYSQVSHRLEFFGLCPDCGPAQG